MSSLNVQTLIMPHFIWVVTVCQSTHFADWPIAAHFYMFTGFFPVPLDDQVLNYFDCYICKLSKTKCLSYLCVTYVCFCSVVISHKFLFCYQHNIFYLNMELPSADNHCKQFGPRSGLIWIQAICHSDCITERFCFYKSLF